jgi:quinoprotein glucose dehydrogenase
MRQNYGKGVATAQIDGRDVLYVTSPAFFLTALDAATGRPLEGFGDPVRDPERAGLHHDFFAAHRGE